MLINYEFGNFRSYYNNQKMSFKVNKDTHSSIPVSQSLLGKSIAISKSSLILGYNGTGKTNLIASLSYLKYLIKASLVNNSNKQPTFYAFEKYRFSKKSITEPVNFKVEFIANDKNLYEYKVILNGDEKGMIVELETLIKRSYTLKERLSSQQIIYTRKNNKIICAEKNIMSFFDTIGLNPNVLILSYFSGDTYCNNEVFNTLKPIEDWFESISVINADKDIPLLIDSLNEDYLNKITKIMKMYSMTLDKLEITNTKLDILPEELSSPQQALNALRHKYPNTIMQGIINVKQDGVFSQNLNTIYKLIDSDNNETISSSIFDNASALVSRGEKKLIFLLPYIFDSIKKGSLLIIDEFDSSLNKLVAGYIIDVFNDNDINKNSAQVILSTQNQLFVDDHDLTKEQIFLTSKSKDGKSNVRCLSDISKDKGKKAIRSGIKFSTYIANEVQETYPEISLNDIKNILV